MKKLIFIVLSLVIIPQVAFAAWWNPFTWNMFTRMHQSKAPELRVEVTTPPLPSENVKPVSTSSVNSEEIPPAQQLMNATSSGLNTATTSLANLKKELPPRSTSTQSTSTKKIVTKEPQAITKNLKDWGKVSSALGFSIKYPYKKVGVGWGDDEYFQIVFMFPPSIIPITASTTEKLSSDIHNIRLYGGLEIVVINDTSSKSADFKTWIKEYLKREDTDYGHQEIKILSEEMLPTTFAGYQGYGLTRATEGSKYQNSPHYTRKEIFIRKDKYIYRFSNLTSSDDTAFPRSGTAGKEYLQQINIFAGEILKTFAFDNSTTTSIKVPKTNPPQLSGEAKVQREKLLADLRKGPFWDMTTTLPQGGGEQCSNPMAENKSSGSLTPAPGIYVSADDKLAELHGYDEDGGHTGLLPSIPGYGSASERGAREINRTNLGSSGYGLSIEENINGRIELIGKSFGYVEFYLRGDGNGCSIVSLQVPITTYSRGILPMSNKGDIGPFSYDIDGDDVEDFTVSLVHPLLPEKKTQINAVIHDMQLAK